MLDTHDILNPDVAATVPTIQRGYQEQYKVFVSECLEKRTTPFSFPIRGTKFPLISNPPTRVVSNTKATRYLPWNSTAPYFHSCTYHVKWRMEFFCQWYPPSLSQIWRLRHWAKADLHCLMDLYATETPDVGALLRDGAATINMLKPDASRTFQEYFEEVFKPYVT